MAKRIIKSRAPKTPAAGEGVIDQGVIAQTESLAAVIPAIDPATVTYAVENEDGEMVPFVPVSLEGAAATPEPKVSTPRVAYKGTVAKTASLVQIGAYPFMELSPRDASYAAFYYEVSDKAGTPGVFTLGDLWEHGAERMGHKAKRFNPYWPTSAKAQDAGALERCEKAGRIVQSDGGRKFTFTPKGWENAYTDYKNALTALGKSVPAMIDITPAEDVGQEELAAA